TPTTASGATSGRPDFAAATTSAWSPRASIPPTSASARGREEFSHGGKKEAAHPDRRGSPVDRGAGRDPAPDRGHASDQGAGRPRGARADREGAARRRDLRHHD